MTDDIKLPPLPADSETPASSQWEWSSQDMRDYALAAIEPYKQRISELEAQLEAIEHAETRMNRAGSSDSEIGLPALPEAEIDDAGAFMSDAQVMTIESAKEYARVAVEHDRQQRGEVVVTWDETQTRIVAVTRQDEVGKILSVIAQANCQRSAEPVGVIREPDQPGEEPWPEVWADLPAGTDLYAEPVQKAQKECSKDAERREPVKVPSEDDIRRVARDMYLAGELAWIGFDRDENGEYTQPTITGGDIALIRALLARYGSKS